MFFFVTSHDVDADASERRTTTTTLTECLSIASPSTGQPRGWPTSCKLRLRGPSSPSIGASSGRVASLAHCLASSSVGACFSDNSSVNGPLVLSTKLENVNSTYFLERSQPVAGNVTLQPMILAPAQVMNIVAICREHPARHCNGERLTFVVAAAVTSTKLTGAVNGTSISEVVRPFSIWCDALRWRILRRV